MLSLSPIYAFATEDAQALTPTTSETPTEAAAETPAPEVSTEAPAAEAPASEVPAQGSVTDGDSIAETPSSEQLNTDTSTDATSDESEKTEEESSDTKTDDKKTDEKVDGEATEDTEETDLEKDSEEELDEELEEELEEEEEEEKDKTSIPEHEHEFEYISNKDGTHIVKCIAPVIQEKEDGEEGETEEVPCDYEVVEECSYDEEGVCIYCKYVKPKEEPKFDPIVSLSINNSYCTIGQTYPVICMSINAEDFDIEYAQICFANYSQNKYINLGLAQGKYFDFKSNDFVYTGSSSWYASPDITNDYAQGNYSVRSVYIRSTTGEAVHYSVESGNLPEGYQNYSIELARPTGMSLIRDLFSSEPNVEMPISDETVPEDIVSEPEESEPVIEEPAIEEPAIDNSTVTAPVPEKEVIPEPETIVEEPKQEEQKVEAPDDNVTKTEQKKLTETPQATEPKVEQPIMEEQPKAEESKATETPRSTTNSNSATNNDSNASQNSGSNSILNFFKKLFGLK